MPDGLRVTRAARARGLARRAAAAMESSFQRLGRGRRFRKKPADEAAASPPADGASAAAATAPRHPGFIAGEGTARARDTASAATPAAPANLATCTPRDEPPSSTLQGSRPSNTDDYNAEPSRPLPGSTRPGLYGQTLVSFGLSDADDLFGGGVPLGSVVLIGADARDDPGRRDCGNASTLVRYFLAEGVASKHAALWMSPGALLGAKKSRAATLPREIVRRDDDEASDTKRDTTTGSRGTEKNQTDDDGLRIAWQYRRYLRQGKALDDSRVGARGVGGLAAGVSATGGSEVPGSNPGKNKNTGGVRRLPSMCHAFDLTREAGGELARTADLRCAPFISQGAKASTSLSASRVSDDDEDAILRAALDECVRLVERCDAFSGADDDTAPVGRIVVQLPDFDDCAFGSDAYRASRADAEEATIARVARFLRGLRGILRGGGGGRNAHATQKFKRVCAVVTYPLASLSPSAAASLVHAVDAAIDLETLPERNANANANETHAFEALLPDPNLCVALLRVRKLAFPGPGAVAPSPLTRMDRTYALQVRRKRLAVRPLRIAPEDAASGSTGKKEKTSSCGGGPADAPNALDF